jgi:putative nucleotidyltransferase with HDIG domain
MRRSKLVTQNQISILAVDDDPIITDTIQDYFKRSGYHVETENNPQVAVQRVREGTFDILLLDFLMAPICGDQVVAQIREFNRDMFIILLTGHKSMAPPVRTIRQLDIQGYYEKDDRFDQLELLVESCVKSIKQMRMLREYESDLSTMVDNLHNIYHLQNCERLSEELLQVVEKLIPFTMGFVMIEHQDGVRWTFSGEKTGAQACQTLTQNAVWDAQNVAFVESWCLIRLVGEDRKTIGVVGILPEKEPRKEKVQLLSILSRQASAAVSNHHLHSRVHLQNQQLEEAYMQTIETLRYAVETKDKETRGHSERVSSLAAAIAQTLGMPEEQVQLIRTAGLFHDIGKIGVRDSILLKNGPLTVDEFREIQNHPAMGENILVAYDPLKEILPIIRSHHERYDGTGYPDKLAGESICLGARIIAVADSFDAMISNRTYRSGLGFEKTVQELQKGKNAQFDPMIVDAFTRMINQMGREGFRQQYCAHANLG